MQDNGLKLAVMDWFCPNSPRFLSKQHYQTEVSIL